MSSENMMLNMIGLLFRTFWWMIPLYVVAQIIKAFRPQIKGKFGERIVSFNTKLHLNGNVYRQINDVTIPSRSGRTTQIDHVVVSPYGIFVIETKNYSGWIYGNADDRQWTSVHYKRKFRFQNPLRQNYGHICALSQLLNIPKSHFHGIVRFIGDAQFKTGMPDGVFTKGHIRHIESFDDAVFSDEEVCSIVKRIETGRFSPGRETNRMHVRGLRSPDYSATDTVGDVTCPRCSASMVSRTARRGPNSGSSFWGCSRYPDCRGTRPA